MRMLPVLPDESLFSRFCRTTTVYGMSPSSLLTIIFNKPDMNVHPILNSGLKAISLHTSESADQLWHEQTLLPLFAGHYQSVVMKLWISTRPCQSLIDCAALVIFH